MSPPPYEIWLLTLPDPYDSLPCIEEKQALLAFLNQETSTEAAASAYTHVVTNTRDPDADILWFLIWKTAEQYPETQPRLVGLLKAIKRLPPITQRDEAGEIIPVVYWGPMGFRDQMRWYWQCMDLDKPDPKVHAAFINLTVFAARLLQEGLLSMETRYVESLREDLGRVREPHLLDTIVQASAQVVLHAGLAVYKHEREKYSLQWWGVWKERLAKVRDRGDLQDSTRAIGKEAVERMEAIEGEAS